uniref:Sulfotransferase domain-containing protein n=1 Tax=Proboscia inermis TaxID=420281 RepID=A0A7S0C4C6_9STRA
MTTATNYGKEGPVDKYSRNIPLRADSQYGPFLQHIGERGIPNYVQTKTHCGGRCGFCSPSKYIETLDSFEQMCRTGSRSINDTLGGTKDVRLDGFPYPKDIVQRATHLIRNPFNNIVSRYHHRQKKHADDIEWSSNNPNTLEGFRAQCKEMNARYSKKERKSRYLSDDIIELFNGVPCHAEFFRYVQWHNLAIETTKRLKLPTHIIHYENYEHDFESTAKGLLEFLSIEEIGDPPSFIAGKDYLHYYTKRQRKATMKLIRRVATPESWELIKRYNVDV